MAINKGNILLYYYFYIITLELRITICHNLTITLVNLLIII